jgi:4-hydroxy-tetrahydrodipicolinate synthase
MDGLSLPLITPFRDGVIDLPSHERLINHYRDSGVTSMVLFGTTGESATVTAAERKLIITRTLALLQDTLPVYVGISGSCTAEVAATVTELDEFGIAGFLVTCPDYIQPSQDGLLAHFNEIAARTEKPIIVYNIPYRTAVNMQNSTLFELHGACPNICAVKDSSADLAQSLNLIATAPPTLTVLAGEDELYFTALIHGASGGILAASHLATEVFVEVARLLRDNDLAAARGKWDAELAWWIPLLFAETNPMPLKYCLWRLGLIESPDCRLPLTRVSREHADVLDAMLTSLMPTLQARLSKSLAG